MIVGLAVILGVLLTLVPLFYNNNDDAKVDLSKIETPLFSKKYLISVKKKSSLFGI
jgi:hypothetical protein